MSPNLETYPCDVDPDAGKTLVGIGPISELMEAGAAVAASEGREDPGARGAELGFDEDAVFDDEEAGTNEDVLFDDEEARTNEEVTVFDEDEDEDDEAVLDDEVRAFEPVPPTLRADDAPTELEHEPIVAGEDDATDEVPPITADGGLLARLDPGFGSDDTREPSPPSSPEALDGAAQWPAHGAERAQLTAARRAWLRNITPYSFRDGEVTKPNVLPLDWSGDDEVTVRWETVRRETRPAPLPFEDLAEPVEDRPSRGFSPRATGMMVGVMAGAAATVGLLALALLAHRPGQVTSAAAALVPDGFVPDVTVEASPVPTITLPPLDALELAETGDGSETFEGSTTTVSMAAADAHHHAAGEAVSPIDAGIPSRPLVVRGSLSVDSNPPSNVVLDGRPLGPTPQHVTVTAGEHVVVFVHPRRGRQTMTIQVPKDGKAVASAKF